jgi:hypothetical protein
LEYELLYIILKNFSLNLPSKMFVLTEIIDCKKKLFHSLGLVYKSMRGMMTNSIDRDHEIEYSLFFYFALGRNRTRDLRVPEPKRTPLSYILYTGVPAKTFEPNISVICQRIFMKFKIQIF